MDVFDDNPDPAVIAANTYLHVDYAPILPPVRLRRYQLGRFTVDWTGISAMDCGVYVTNSVKWVHPADAFAPF